jgi:hypothetical protein
MYRFNIKQVLIEERIKLKLYSIQKIKIVGKIEMVKEMKYYLDLKLVHR